MAEYQPGNAKWVLVQEISGEWGITNISAGNFNKWISVEHTKQEEIAMVRKRYTWEGTDQTSFGNYDPSSFCSTQHFSAGIQ